MSSTGQVAPVGTKAPETGQYKHSACSNTIIVNKGETMPPCQNAKCERKGADWVLQSKLT